MALLSDMYLSSEQIRRILASAGLDLSQVDTLLVSSEEHEGKSSGHLFARLQEFYPQIASEGIVHIGDNVAADVEGAAKAGIRGCIIQSFWSILRASIIGNLSDMGMCCQNGSRCGSWLRLRIW